MKLYQKTSSQPQCLNPRMWCWLVWIGTGTVKYRVSVRAASHLDMELLVLGPLLFHHLTAKRSSVQAEIKKDSHYTDLNTDHTFKRPEPGARKSTDPSLHIHLGF